MNKRIIKTIFILIILLFCHTKLTALATYTKKGVAIGLEGNLNFNIFFAISNSNTYDAPLYISSGRLGLNIANGKPVRGIAKYSYENAIGYIFVPGGNGMYYNGAIHFNKRLGKSYNYFYTGYGGGIEIIGSHGNRYDIDFQLARIPLGFKFVLDDIVEFFIDWTFVFGLRIVDYKDADGWTSSGNYDDTIDNYFSMNGQLKAGLRFWF